MECFRCEAGTGFADSVVACWTDTIAMRTSALTLLHVLRQSAGASAGRCQSREASTLLSALPYILEANASRPRTISRCQIASFASQAAAAQPLVWTLQAYITVISLNSTALKRDPCCLLQRRDLFNTHPRSLQYDRPSEEPRPEVAHSRIRQALLTLSGFYSKESQLLRGGCNVLPSC